MEATTEASAPDWIVRSVIDLGPGNYFRYVVRGTNLSAIDERDREFSWSLHTHPETNHRYDLTNAEFLRA